jgi:hypothetical protein
MPTKAITQKHIIQKKHEGKWVALSSDFQKVLGYSTDVTSLVKKFGRDDVTYTKILKSDVVYAFTNQ